MISSIRRGSRRWLPSAAQQQAGGRLSVVELDDAGATEHVVGDAGAALLPASQRGGWFPELPPAYRVVYGDTVDFSGKRQLALLIPQAGYRNRLLVSDANDYEPAISPDGTQIAFVSDRAGSPQLYLLVLGANWSLASQTAIPLTNALGCSTEHPSWLPDGSGLIYESNCQDGHWAIYRVQLSYTLTSQAAITVARPISPVAIPATRLSTTGANDRWPRISPDGSHVAFFSDRDGNTEIYTMRIDGSQQTRLTTNSGRDEAPAWSPDGTQLAFNSNRTGHNEIYVMNSDGTGQTQRTSGGGESGYAVWSP